jgi:hypothetical protein
LALAIIFGPPAVGKMTVGLELERLTGFRLFHNHMVGRPRASNRAWYSSRLLGCLANKAADSNETPMLYMVIETFRDGNPVPVYRASEIEDA